MKAGDRVRHYYTDYVYTILVPRAKSLEPGDDFVIYEGPTGTWARRWSDFHGLVEHNGRNVNRFERIGEDDV